MNNTISMDDARRSKAERDMSWEAESRRAYTAIWDSQEKWIEQHCGKEAADRSNYGWYSYDALPEYLVVHTKVYRHGVLISILQGPCEAGRIRHSFESFDR